MLRPGLRIVVTEGCYSSYGIVSHAVVLKLFDLDERVEAWLTLHPEQRERNGFSTDGFVAALVVEGYLVEHRLPELWLGSYGHAQGEDGVRFYDDGVK